MVFLVFCTETDHADNSLNCRYGGYYRPYCLVVGNHVELRGVPVPRSERVWFSEHHWLARSRLVRLLARGYFAVRSPPVLQFDNPTGALLRIMQKYVASRGGVFLAGLTDRSPVLEQLLQRAEVPFMDLSTPLRHPDPSYGRHWTPQGHTYVCDRIEQFLITGGYMAKTEVR